MAFSQYLENQGIQIAQGRVLNTSHIHKSGSVPQMSVNTTGTVWDINDTPYPWATTFDTGASILTVDCANAAEVGHDVVIVGLDANYQEIQETVDITTLTGNTTTNSFKRVY